MRTGVVIPQPALPIILGSSSPYRQQVLRQLGLEFTVVSPGIDERAIRYEDPELLALALAGAKAETLAAKVTEPALLITADQVVVWQGQIREKPRSEEEARYFLESASEAPSETVSAVMVVNMLTGNRVSGVDRVRIYFRPIPREVIDETLRKGEVFHCSGGLRVEDPLTAPYLERMDGTLGSVMGMPEELTCRLLREVSS
jgi:septum formation protein